MFRKKQRNIFGILDIGSETVKFLIIAKKDNKRIILGKAVAEYKLFSVFDSGDFEKDILKKTINEAVKEAELQANLAIKNLILGLSPHILKARVFCQRFIREKPELKIDKREEAVIIKEINKKLQKDAAAEDTLFLSKKIIEIRMNGYRIPEFVGFLGKNLNITILVTFLPKHFFKKIEEIIQGLGFQIIDIVHEAEGIISSFRKDKNGLFIDIGGYFTQIFLMKDNSLTKVSEFEFGGRNFLEALSKNFGILYNEIEELAKDYQRDNLQEPLKARIKEVFQKEVEAWFSFLSQELNGNDGVFENIFCFGSGAGFPEIKEILEKSYNSRVKMIGSKDFPEIEDRTEIADSNHYIPCLLLAHMI